MVHGKVDIVELWVICQTYLQLLNHARGSGLTKVLHTRPQVHKLHAVQLDGIILQAVFDTHVQTFDV